MGERKNDESIIKCGNLTSEEAEKAKLMMEKGYWLNAPLVKLSDYKIDKAVVGLIPKELAEKFNLIAVSFVGDTLLLALSFPINPYFFDEIKFTTGFNLKTIIVSSSDLRNAFLLYYD